MIEYTNDELTTLLTGQPDFESLVSAGEGGYVPTFCGGQNFRREERKLLADRFDEERTRRRGPLSSRCCWGEDA